LAGEEEEGGDGGSGRFHDSVVCCVRLDSTGFGSGGEVQVFRGGCVSTASLGR
jgi:hypothetical protein